MKFSPTKLGDVDYIAIEFIALCELYIRYVYDWVIFTPTEYIAFTGVCIICNASPIIKNISIPIIPAMCAYHLVNEKKNEI